MNMGLPCNSRVLDGRRCFSKICMYLSALVDLYQVTSQSTNNEPDDFCPLLRRSQDQKLGTGFHFLGFNRALVSETTAAFLVTFGGFFA